MSRVGNDYKHMMETARETAQTHHNETGTVGKQIQFIAGNSGLDLKYLTECNIEGNTVIC